MKLPARWKISHVLHEYGLGDASGKHTCFEGVICVVIVGYDADETRGQRRMCNQGNIKKELRSLFDWIVRAMVEDNGKSDGQ